MTRLATNSVYGPSCEKEGWLSSAFDFLSTVWPVGSHSLIPHFLSQVYANTAFLLLVAPLAPGLSGCCPMPQVWSPAVPLLWDPVAPCAEGAVLDCSVTQRQPGAEMKMPDHSSILL